MPAREALLHECKIVKQSLKNTHYQAELGNESQNCSLRDYVCYLLRGKINLVGGILSVDDTVIDKPYSQLRNVIGYFWSGKHKRVVKGVNLITLYRCDRVQCAREFSHHRFTN